nr:hypothetical protein BgiMline_023718 [Biomphalaria glabrata]
MSNTVPTLPLCQHNDLTVPNKCPIRYPLYHCVSTTTLLSPINVKYGTHFTAVASTTTLLSPINVKYGTHFTAVASTTTLLSPINVKYGTHFTAVASTTTLLSPINVQYGTHFTTVPAHPLRFIGTVKAEENYFYPPEVMYEPLKLPKFVPPVKFKDTLVQVPVTYRGNTSESHLGQRTLPGCETWRRPKQYVDSYDVWWTRH